MSSITNNINCGHIGFSWTPSPLAASETETRKGECEVGAEGNLNQSCEFNSLFV